MVNKRKDRRKMTVEELFDTEHYRSIIILTDIFDKNNGLRQLHYRWALIKNHDNMKHALFVRAMQDFFDKDNNLSKKLGYSNDHLFFTHIFLLGVFTRALRCRYCSWSPLRSFMLFISI